MQDDALTRRNFLILSGGLAAGVVLGGDQSQAGIRHTGIGEFRMLLTQQHLLPNRQIATKTVGGWIQSPPISSNRRFDLLGVKRGSTAAKLQLRTHGKRGWSDWVPLGSGCGHAADGSSRSGWSDPIWAGQSDRFQLRSNRPLPALEIQMISAKRSLAGSRSSNLTTRSTQRQRSVSARSNGQPTIITREQWGAEAYPPRSESELGSVELAFVHHTVSTNDYTAEESADVVLSILRYHRNTNGWNDIGYNFLVDKYGQIFEGRSGGIDQAVIGAQAQGYNAVSTGIAAIGTHTSEPLSEAALAAISKLIAWKLSLHGAATSGEVTVESAGGSQNRYSAGKMVTLNRVSGHRDGNSTSCPGDQLYGQMDDLRQRVAAIPTGSGSLSLSVKTVAASYPLSFTASGKLKDSSGATVANATVELQRYGSKGYRKLSRVKTNDKGEWTVTSKSSSTTKLRALHIDETGATARQSVSRNLKVKPVIAARLNRKKIRRKGSVNLNGKLQPSSARLTVTLQRKRGSSYRTETTQRITVKDGEFKLRLRPKLRGSYRVKISFAGNSKLSASEASPLTLRVG